MAAVKGGNTEYFGVWFGKICKTSKEPKPGYVLRKVKDANGNPKEKYTDDYAGISGKIAGIVYRKKELDGGGVIEDVLITLVDDKGRYALSLGFNGEGRELIKKIPNILTQIKPEDTVYISISSDTNNRSLFLKNESTDEWIKNYYTKDNPNGMPEIEKVMVRGEEKWNSEKQMNFLYDVINTTYKEEIKKVFGVNNSDSGSSHDASDNNQRNTSAASTATSEPEYQGSAATGEDDLPF